MRYLPVGLDLRDRDALVAGAGAEVPAKVDRLLACGAKVTVIAPEPDRAIEELAAAGAISLHRREVEDADLEGRAIVFTAPTTTPEEEARARRFHAEAVRRGTLLCTIDRPEVCTFVSQAVVRAEGLTVSIATDGASPGLARRIREDLEAALSAPEVARFVKRLAEMRAALPRGERAGRMAEAVRGFAMRIELTFPRWFHDEPGA